MNRYILIKRIALFLYILSFLIVGILPLYVFKNGPVILFSIAAILIYAAFLEIAFHCLYRAIFKKPYFFIPRIPFKEIYIEPHPYLPYVYKKNFLTQKRSRATYPLNKDKGYMINQVITNNYRHVNGPDGNRDIVVPKPKDLIRINCYGASTTGNYLFYKGRHYSYPLILEEILQKTFPGRAIEVNNCGNGGYTTAEILIKFLLSTIDTKPDIAVFYHAYNDLGISLTPGYEEDYSHGRKNLGEVYHLYRLASMIPSLPLASWNFAVNNLFFNQNLRFAMPGAVERQSPDIKMDFQGTNTYKRNIDHFINICKSNNIQAVLSTFSYYLYEEVKSKARYIKYGEGVRLENNAMRELAQKHGLPLVENDRLIPKEEKYFVDTVHFSPEGMELLAENMSGPIIEHIKRNLTGGSEQ